MQLHYLLVVVVVSDGGDVKVVSSTDCRCNVCCYTSCK